jgi:hypothetical protein
MIVVVQNANATGSCGSGDQRVGDRHSVVERTERGKFSHRGDRRASDGSIERRFPHVIQASLQFAELGVVAGAVEGFQL